MRQIANGVRVFSGLILSLAHRLRPPPTRRAAVEAPTGADIIPVGGTTPRPLPLVSESSKGVAQ
jgi:hypothetical protein